MWVKISFQRGEGDGGATCLDESFHEMRVLRIRICGEGRQRGVQGVSDVGRLQDGEVPPLQLRKPAGAGPGQGA